METTILLNQETHPAAKNNEPVNVVLSRCGGIGVEDVDVNRYIDFLGACSAEKHGY